MGDDIVVRVLVSGEASVLEGTVPDVFDGPLRADRVTEFFAVESHSRSTHEPPVFGIRLVSRRSRVRCLSISCRGDHQSLNVLDVPAAANELAGQPIE